MKTIPIIILLLLFPFVSMAQDSLQSVYSVPGDSIHSSEVVKYNITRNETRNDFSEKPDTTLSRIILQDSVILSKIDEIEVDINNFIARTLSLGMASAKKQHEQNHFSEKSDTTLSRIMLQDSVILSKIDEIGVDINNFVAKPLSLGMASAKKQNEQLQSLLVMIRISVCLLVAVIVILVAFFVLLILLYSKAKKRICKETKSELKEIINGLTSELNDLISRQSYGLKECIIGQTSELKNGIDELTSQLQKLIARQTSELKECYIGQTNAEVQIEEPLLPPTERERVAYDDAVQAFVNINNYIYDLKRYNSLITPYILWFVSENVEQPHVDISSVSDEDRSKIALLVSKIDQFKQNHVQAINRYLSRTKMGKNYATCLRCPIKGHFDPALDQHLLGEDLEHGEEIHSVYKIGFLFPDSKAHPYREKSLII